MRDIDRLDRDLKRAILVYVSVPFIPVLLAVLIVVVRKAWQ